MNAARPSFTLHVRQIDATHVLTRFRVRIGHVRPAPTPTPARSFSRTLVRSPSKVLGIANMGDRALSLKRVHTEERSVSPPPVKRRQQSATTSTSEISTAEANGSHLTRASQTKPWRISLSHLPRSRSPRKRYPGSSSRTASSPESIKLPTQHQPPQQTSLEKLLFLTLYVRTPSRFSHGRRRSIDCVDESVRLILAFVHCRTPLSSRPNQATSSLATRRTGSGGMQACLPLCKSCTVKGMYARHCLS